MRAEPSLFLWLVKTPSRAEPARSGSRARPNMAQAGPEGKSYLIPYLLQSARSHGLKDAGDMHHVMCELVIFQLHNIYILILDDANDVNMARTLCCCPSTAASSASSFEGRAEPGSARSCAEPSLGSARFQPYPWPSQTKVWRTVRRSVLVLVTAVRIPNRASFFVRIKACDTYV